MRKKRLGIIGVFVLAVALAATARAADPIRLFVNGREIRPDVSPQLVNGRTMVPLRWVAEALGANVQWDAANRAVVVNSSLPVNEGSLPKVLENLGARFEGIEIPVYVPAYLPGGGDLAITGFRTTKDGYSFKVVRRDGAPVSLAEEVVSVEAAPQPFPPYPTEAQVFSAIPETVEVDGRQVASYGSGTGAKWRQGNWEFLAIGSGPGEGLNLAGEIIRALPENVSPVPGAAQGKLRASQLGNPLHVTAGWTYDGRTWYTLDGRSSVEEMVKMLGSIVRLPREGTPQARYYPQIPKRITSPEMALQAYFDALFYAANLTPAQMAAAGGTVGMGEQPYRTAYGYWSEEWQAAHPYEEFLASWQGTASVELLQLLPAGQEAGQPRFFVEVQTLEAVGEKPRLGVFYYWGFFTVAETAAGWRLTGGGLEPENLGWKLGGHQPWRGDPVEVAHVKVGSSIDAPLGEAVTQNNPDGTVTVSFVDAAGQEVHQAVLAQTKDGIWRVLAWR